MVLHALDHVYLGFLLQSAQSVIVPLFRTPKFALTPLQRARDMKVLSKISGLYHARNEFVHSYFYKVVILLLRVDCHQHLCGLGFS